MAHEMAEGVLGSEYDHADRSEIQTHVRNAEEEAKDEVWAGYRFVALADTQEEHGLKIIDLGAGHSSASETLCGRIISALKAEARLNENVGAGYIDRHWPHAFQGTGAWPLMSLRQSFLNGSLTRLIDPDTILRRQITEFVSKGEFGLASGTKDDGSYGRLWYAETVRPEEVAFESNVFLLTRVKAKELKSTTGVLPSPQPEPCLDPSLEPESESEPESDPEPTPGTAKTTLRLVGTVPPEIWNRLGTKVLPKLRFDDDISIGIEFSVSVGATFAKNMESELRQILNDLDLGDRVRLEKSSEGPDSDE